MFRHIGLAATVVALVALTTENLHARGGGHSGRSGFGRSFGTGSYVPGNDLGAGVNAPSHSRRASRIGNSYATTSTGSNTPSTTGSWKTRGGSNPSSTSSTTQTPATNATNGTVQSPSQSLVTVSPFGISPYAGSLDPNTAAQRSYGYLLRNARQLIQAGLYGPAAMYLYRIINGAPGTRIAAEAQHLLAALPVI